MDQLELFVGVETFLFLLLSLTIPLQKIVNRKRKSILRILLSFKKESIMRAIKDLENNDNIFNENIGVNR